MPTRPKDRYKTIESNPHVGGNLITAGSADNAGIFNYVEKFNYRRDLDIEQRREGCDYFYPNITLPVAGQPYPGQLSIDQLTRAGTTATASRAAGHHFQNGESIIITGANNAAYNGTFTILNVTPTSFDYVIVGAPGTPDGSATIVAAPLEEVNLVALARRPNGQTAVIAGSQHRLYRYYALEDPDYISKDATDYPPGTPLNELFYWSQDAIDYPIGTPIDQLFYIDENPGYWIVIGYGFSDSGRRWEAEPINGYLCLNNGVDLPMTYRVEELFVTPIYELRENGVASVGTIANFNGFLMCADITEIHSDVLANWFNTAGYVAVTSLTRVGAVVTGTIAAGQPFKLGETIVIKGAAHAEYNGTWPVIAATATTFQFAIGTTPATPDGGAGIQARLLNAAYGIYTDQSTVDRTQYRVLWGIADEPRRFAATVPGSIAAGSNVVTLDYPVLGFDIGQSILITGAGQSHAGGTADNLTATILNIDGATLVINAFALTTVTSVPVLASDAEFSTAGFEDLQDDGSGILKMLMLFDQLIIYKETSMFVCQYIGSIDQPFAFSIRRIAVGTGLFYRNTLILAETPTETIHLYAGRGMFYRWDLTNQQPMVLPKFESCSDLFFNAANLEDTERIFAFENGETGEICFCFPSSGTTKALCWDYVWDTISTTDMQMSSGATIRKPETGIAVGAGEDWCIFGTNTGAVLVYGLTDIPQTVAIATITRVGAIATATLADGQPMFMGDTVEISGAAHSAYNGTFTVLSRSGNTFTFTVVGAPVTPDGGTSIRATMAGTELFYRRGANPFDSTRLPYNWVLNSGLGHFGYRNGEKDMNQFLLQLASQCPDTGVTVSIYGTINANAPTSLVASKTFTDPEFVCNLAMMARNYYFQSSISGAGIDAPFRLVGSIWRIAPVDSRSAGRTL